MKLIVTMDWLGQISSVGELDVFNTRGFETYQFVYAKEWVEKGFQIDPMLSMVAGFPQYSQSMPGAFQDISPDRWGRLVHKRIGSGGYASEADFLLGVSDLMRMGALRLSDANDPDRFLADNTNVPKLVNIRELEDASRRLERGMETADDLRQLLGPGTSLGGARPKAAVQDNGVLYLAKFQSNMDTERTGCWEATMLDMAQQAGIPTATHRLLNKDDARPVLLLERFDRTENGRVPFASAMTVAGLKDGQEFSYGELASVMISISSQPKLDNFDLWRRMTFNAMTGNTDDHLRNHGFIRDRQGWRLSPAYDLNPNDEPLERRAHALAFLPGEKKPSLNLCKEMAGLLNLRKDQVEHGLKALGSTLATWRNTAKRNGLTDSEIRRRSRAFEHTDSEQLANQVATQRGHKSRI